MCRRREQGGRGSDVGRDDVRRPEIGLGDELGEETTHGAWRHQLVPPFGGAEPGQVDGDQASVLGEGRPHARERVDALRPGAGQQHRVLAGASAVGVSDLQPVDDPEPRLNQGCQRRGHARSFRVFFPVVLRCRDSNAKAPAAALPQTRCASRSFASVLRSYLQICS